MDSMRFRPAQRRKLLIWSGVGGALVLIAVVGLALAPHVPAGLPGPLLIIAGGVGLLLAPLTLNAALGHTVLSDRGIRTGGIITRHRCRWSEVEAITTTEIHARASYDTAVEVQLTSGKRFRLAAPFDPTNGEDPEFLSKVGQIEAYWYAQLNRAG